MQANTVMLYSKPNCVQCTATEREFGKQGIAYQKVDLTQDQAAMGKIQDLGYRQVPVVIAGDQHWSGFQPAKISTLVS